MHRVDDTPGVLAFGRDRGFATLCERTHGQNVLAILTESTTDEWFLQWERSAGTASRLGLVECYEFVRGSAAHADDSLTVSGALSLSTVQRPVETDALLTALEKHLDEWRGEPEKSLLYVESGGQLGESQDTVVETIDRLRRRPDTPEFVVTVDPETDALRTVVELQHRLPETVGALEPDTEAIRAVTRLREADPTTFGYLTRYWREALRALEAADRTYPRAKQLHETVEDGLSPRMLGAALSGLAWLKVISIRGETNGPNRYDCRNFDPERAARLGFAAESLTDTSR